MTDPALETLIATAPDPAGEEKTYLVEGKELDRVTHILHKVLPPYLSVWAQNVGVEGAHKVSAHMNDTLPSSPEDTLHMMKEMGLDIEARKLAGGARGANTHFALETWIKQGIPPNLDDFEPEHRNYGQNLSQFLIDYEPEFECSELTVWHPELLYAGTVDAIGKATKRPKGVRHPDITGMRFAWDAKTNEKKRIYVQHYFQLAAYRGALDYHKVELEGEAVIAIGPDPKKPYSVGVNYIPARLWPPVVECYRALVEAQKLNPRSRS